jgi:hypothetical protein
MLSVPNAHRAATTLLYRFGEVAIAVAMLRAQQAQSHGNLEEMTSWHRIAEAAVNRAGFNSVDKLTADFRACRRTPSRV